MKEHCFDLLRVFYDRMENEGINKKIFRSNIDDDFVEALNLNYNLRLTLEECERIADICLANEWLEHTVAGGKYIQLRLTTTGLGVVKSKLRQKEISENKSLLKKLSDYVNDHSGVFVLLSFMISFLSLVAAGLAIFISLKQGN